MTDRVTRRSFVKTSGMIGGAAAIFGFDDFDFLVQDGGYQATDDDTMVVPPEFPGQDRGSVMAIVAAAHAQLDKVTEMVSARPALAKASWDWGFGDWESALGAASHMGRHDIAEVLMAHGARPDIFTFAMLGRLEVVRSMVEASPGIQRTPGPHGIILMQHARMRLNRKGLTEPDYALARGMIQYLEGIGEADIAAESQEMQDGAAEAFLGVYRFGDGNKDVLTVYQHRRGWLMLKRGAQGGRRLHYVASETFAPAGAPAVRIRFEVANGSARTVTVHDPIPLVKAVREA